MDAFPGRPHLIGRRAAVMMLDHCAAGAISRADGQSGGADAQVSRLAEDDGRNLVFCPRSGPSPASWGSKRWEPRLLGQRWRCAWPCPCNQPAVLLACSPQTALVVYNVASFFVLVS